MAHDVDRFLRDVMDMQLEVLELSPRAAWIGPSYHSQNCNDAWWTRGAGCICEKESEAVKE